MQPFLVSSSPSSSYVNLDVFFFSFEFSEPILLLYNSSQPFLENLRRFTPASLLALFCSPLRRADCIELSNARVRSASLAMDRISVQVEALQDSAEVALRVPPALLTDYAGNAVTEDLRQSVRVELAPLQVRSLAVLVRTRSAWRPMLRLTFTAPVLLSSAASCITVHERHADLRQPVASADLLLQDNVVLFPIDSQYNTLHHYSILIPPGLFKDQFNHYFRGFDFGELELSARVLWGMALLDLLDRFRLFFAIPFFGAGLFLGFWGWG